MVELLTGVLKYTTIDDQKKYLAISGGAAEITPYQITIITDSAEGADTIDVARAQEAATRAQQRIKEKFLAQILFELKPLLSVHWLGYGQQN